MGFTLASSGDGLALGAVPLLAVVVDPHPLPVSAVAASDTLPWLLMALPAGALADRFERGNIAALANILRAFVILFAALLILRDRMTLLLLILVVLVNASARAVYYTSFQAMVPGLVDRRDLEHANGVLTATDAGAEQTAGPIVGASLFAWSQSLPFLADALALVLSCFPFVRLRSKVRPSEISNPSILEGARLLLANPPLRILLVMGAFLSGLQGMESGVLVLLATTEWGVREGAYGAFLAAGGVGAVLGSILADGQVRRFGSARTLIGAAIVSGVAYLLMASAHSWLLAGPAFALGGLGVGAGSVVAISLRQRLTPPDLMGRVGGAWRGIVWGAVPVGALLGGSLATIAGLRLPLVLAGLLQCAVAVVLARPLYRSLQDGVRTAS